MGGAGKIRGKGGIGSNLKKKNYLENFGTDTLLNRLDSARLRRLNAKTLKEEAMAGRSITRITGILDKRGVKY
jgi:hypothetical protein